MNSFVKSSSKLFLLITCFFIFTLFVDQANLLDIFFGNNSNIDIQHPEEVEKCRNESSAFLNRTDFSSNTMSKKSKVNLPVNYSSIDRRIITDEDSPSTETINADVIVIDQAFHFEETNNYTFTTISESIYLRNSTFLI